MFAIINISNINCSTLFKAEVIKGGFKTKEKAIRFAAKLKTSEWAVVKSNAQRGMVVRIDGYHYAPGSLNDQDKNGEHINVKRVFWLNQDFRFIDVILLDPRNNYQPFEHHSYEWRENGELKHDVSKL